MHRLRSLATLGLVLAGCLDKVRVVDDDAEASGPRGASRSCSGPSDCPISQSCCPTGLISSCQTLQGDGRCPAPDLRVSMLAGSLRIEERTFDGARVEDACALEKRCISELGSRRLLHFGVRTTNAGNADLLLGAPHTTARFRTAACDGKPYLEDYLRYTLVEISTARLVAEGHMQALCERQPIPASLISPFDCQFPGLWQGFSEIYGPDVADCQWLDITDVVPGEYVLSVNVNSAGYLSESDFSNNKTSLPITLPTADPLSLCPVPYEGLSGYGAARECGWSVVARASDAGIAPAPAEACTPGETIDQRCATCTGRPMLRACDGAGLAACSAGEALASAIPQGPCPSVSFACPASGRYRLLMATYAAGIGGNDLYGLQTQPAGCQLVSAPPEAGEDTP